MAAVEIFSWRKNLVRRKKDKVLYNPILTRVERGSENSAPPPSV